jgi:hypothetical protein
VLLNKKKISFSVNYNILCFQLKRIISFGESFSRTIWAQHRRHPVEIHPTKHTTLSYSLQLTRGDQCQDFNGAVKEAKCSIQRLAMRTQRYESTATLVSCNRIGHYRNLLALLPIRQQEVKVAVLSYFRIRSPSLCA